ncbi:hypothetical protein JIN84_20655 [Luteolibacter yonseiensis]|uniref:Uncharacterized protein n=1 Tax=Luteolibacter yonseiensis TaxID=1144680 RepID=A0A934VDH8_9BACT|nr:hypothetical protein [Luteolibacter yonseiensis]MBK1818046.1 hypothetical protein [Luteolibacter yonseiensis]
MILTGVTHCAALLSGWAGWKLLDEGVHGSGTQAAETQRPRTGEVRSSDEILAIIAPERPRPKLSPAEWREKRAAYLNGLPELVKTMPVPDDLEAALEEEVKGWKEGDHGPSARLATLMYQWAAKDMPGLLKWLKEGVGPDNARGAAAASHLGDVVQQLAGDKGVDSVLPFFDGGLESETIFATSRTLGESGNLKLLAEFKGKLVPDQWNSMKFFLSSQCPWERRSTIVEFARSENQPEIVANFGRFQKENSSEAAAWILEMLGDESLDAEFRERLSDNNRLNEIALSSAVLPMDQRIALMRKGEAGPADQNLYDELARTDVAKILIHGRDWTYEFRHGNVEAGEVLASIAKELPETNLKAAEAVRVALFQNLAEEDGGRAIKLLEGLTPTRRAEVVLDTARNGFHYVNPEAFLTALRQVPEDDPQYRDARLDAWVRHGPENYERLDEGYVKWVRNLPEGLDRDMALYSLSLASAKSNPSLAQSLRSEVRDEELKRRMSNP